MNKTILIACVACIMASCKSKETITVNHSNLTEKEQILIENNENYSTASIVGGGAELITVEQKNILEKKLKDREEKLKNISGLKISSLEDNNGNRIFKATMQNEILFNFDSHELTENAKAILDELIQVINDIPDTKIKIVGHTDNIGKKEYNMVLSKNRATAVGNYLRNSGIEIQNITEQGKGFDEPIASNDTELGRSKNRRVEIFLSSKI